MSKVYLFIFEPKTIKGHLIRKKVISELLDNLDVRPFKNEGYILGRHNSDDFTISSINYNTYKILFKKFETVNNQLDSIINTIQLFADKYDFTFYGRLNTSIQSDNVFTVLAGKLFEPEKNKLQTDFLNEIEQMNLMVQALPEESKETTLIHTYVTNNKLISLALNNPHLFVEGNNNIYLKHLDNSLDWVIKKDGNIYIPISLTFTDKFGGIV